MRTLLRRAVRLEAGTWRSLARGVTRRPDVPSGAVPFTYHLPLVAPAVVMAGLSLLEVVAVDVLVPWPWTALRVAVLGVGVWGALLVVGMGVGAVTYPHLVTAEGLRVRAGAGFDSLIAWEDVAEIRRVRRDHAGIRAVRVDDGVLSVGVGNTTNVAVRLRRPNTARLPRGPVEATMVHLYADDAAAVVASAREQLARTPAGGVSG